MQLQQPICFFRKAFLDRVHNLVVLRHGEFKPAHLVQPQSPIGGHAIADAKRQFDEALVAARRVNGVVKGLVCLLIALPIAQFRIFTASVLSRDDGVHITIQA